MRLAGFATALLAIAACGGGSSPLRTPEPIATTTATIGGMTLAADTLYVSTSEGVFALPTAGGEPQPLTSMGLGANLRATAEALYGGFQDLGRLPLAGGSVAVLAADAEIAGFTIDGDRLLWTTRSATAAASVFTRPIGADAVTPTVLASGGPIEEGGPIYADGERIFVATNKTFSTTIVSLAPDGSDARKVTEEDVSGLGGIRAITGAGERLYFIASTGGGTTATFVAALPKSGSGPAAEFTAPATSDDPRCGAHSGIAVHADRLWVACRTERGTKLRAAPLDGGAFATVIELLDADNGDGSSYQITTPVFDADHAYVATGFTVYRVDAR